MKKVFMVLAVIIIITPVLLLGGCRPSGPTVTRDYSITDFNRVQVSSAFEIEITQADTYSISVTAPENWFEYIDVEKTVQTLEIGMDIKFWGFWNRMTAQPKVIITMPSLEILDMSGATSGLVRGFESAQDFRLNLSGASRLDMEIAAYDTSLTISGASELSGQLDAHDVRINLSGASSTELAGTINNLNLQVSGASHADLEEFPGQDARVELSGASNATVSIDGTLDIFLSGASELKYTGNPMLGSVDITGASSMHRK